jgi:esterase/lipase
MKKELPLFNGNIFNEKYSSGEKSEEAVLLFHGYPSPEGKNEYIAESIANKFKKDVYLIHYEGLGLSKGFFSFSKSIKDSGDYFKWLSNEGYKKISIVGHSWGGLIALNLIADQKPINLNKIILMSPYTFFPKGYELEKLIDFIYEDSKSVFKQSKAEMTTQVNEILLSFQPRSKVQSIETYANQISILQAISDHEVPLATTKNFVEMFKGARPNFIEIDTDHSFNERRDQFLLTLGKILEQR